MVESNFNDLMQIIENYNNLDIILGKCLHFNSIMIMMLVIRNLITKLRELGFGSILPLDENIYAHKICGYIIFVQAWFHGIMHVLNLCKI